MELTEKEKKEKKGKCKTCGKVILEGIAPWKRHLDPDFINTDCKDCKEKKEK